MNVTINGEQTSVSDDATIAQVLVEHELVGKPCAVEVNRDLIPRSQHDSHELHDGDSIEIVTLVGGG